jgi:pyruvate,orthophosphate dikinase
VTHYIFNINHSHQCAPTDLNELPGKGADLAEMTSVIDLPAPPGFTISTPVPRVWSAEELPGELVTLLAGARQLFEHVVRNRLGKPVDSLLMSVRLGAKFLTPGIGICRVL